jgi:hypothetical protein
VDASDLPETSSEARIAQFTPRSVINLRSHENAKGVDEPAGGLEPVDEGAELLVVERRQGIGRSTRSLTQLRRCLPDKFVDAVHEFIVARTTDIPFLLVNATICLLATRPIVAL